MRREPKKQQGLPLDCDHHCIFSAYLPNKVRPFWWDIIEKTNFPLILSGIVLSSAIFQLPL
jgi:hypothetical protein